MNRLSKWTLIFILASYTMLYNSCKLLKPTRKIEEVKKEQIKDNRIIRNDIIDFGFNFDSIYKDKSQTNYLEDISIKKPSTLQPIELTATFRIDTTAYLHQDTLLKLVDINDAKVSVTIYQNKKTNELTAKVTTKRTVRDVAFDELQIKRSLNKVNDVTDSVGKKESNFQDKSILEHNKEEIKTASKIIEKDTLQGIFIGILLVGAVIWIAFTNKKEK